MQVNYQKRRENVVTGHGAALGGPAKERIIVKFDN